MEDLEKNKPWNTASLRIGSSVLQCEDITLPLQVQPTRCCNKGDLISRRNPNSKLRTESVWTLDSGLDKSKPLEEHIEVISDFVEKKSCILNELSSKITITIFIGFSSSEAQSSFVISSRLLKCLSLVPLEMVFDLYFSPDNSDEFE